MRTSNFSRHGKDPNAVSIALKNPPGYHGRCYNKLAPPYWLLNKYKKDHDESFYISAYEEHVLSRLNAKTVFQELSNDAVLLCYEKPGEFCHRRLVANWFKNQLDIDIAEI